MPPDPLKLSLLWKEVAYESQTAGDLSQGEVRTHLRLGENELGAFSRI